MMSLRTVVLLHTRRDDRHWDWLIENPAAPGVAEDRAAPLWCARCDRPPEVWQREPFLLTPLPPHRRRYLFYQGQLTDGRGTVRGIAVGHARPLLWTASRRVVTVTWHGASPLTLHLTRLTPDRWRGVALPSDPRC